jgi:TATA-box binding protein (TBP) (component of TFIID and TFIIIB)
MRVQAKKSMVESGRSICTICRSKKEIAVKSPLLAMKFYDTGIIHKGSSDFEIQKISKSELPASIVVNIRRRWL